LSLETSSSILVTCPRDIPHILSREITDLGYEVTAQFPAGVQLQGTFADCYRLNLWLRTAHRVLYQVRRATCVTPHDVYNHVYDIPWHTIVPKHGYVCVVSSISTPTITNTQFANVRCKDAIVDRIRAETGERPDSGPLTDRTVVFLYWHGTECIVYIDTSGKPLSERGYRIHPGHAPMKESLAAAVVLQTSWQPMFAFQNPMCGSGTLAIEAALIRKNLAPGLFRSNFGFQHVQAYQPKEWEQATKNAKEQQLHDGANQPIVCSDRDSSIVWKATENIKRAGVDDVVQIHCCDFTHHPLSESQSTNNVIVMNPEYGKRLGQITELEGVYKSIGDWFKASCTGYTGYVFTGNLELAKQVGLKAKHRTPFWNADIECRLFSYELYAGTRRVYAGKDQ
jgi:23S rRNA G2445 N2-methylase RlmL